MSPALADRVPPHSLEAEMAVLGSMLIEREAIDRALEILDSKHFYHDAHRKIFEAMLHLYQQNRAVDVVTLTEELKTSKLLGEVGGPTYLTDLIHQVSTAAHIQHYAHIVHQKGILRELIHAATQIVERSYTEQSEAGVLLDQAESAILSISQKQALQGFEPASKIAHDVIENIEALHQKKTLVTGVPTSFAEFDRLTGGLQKSDLIILAARPSQGKTALALNIAAHVSIEKNIPTAIFSLEMNKQSIVTRLICSEVGANLSEVRRGYFRRELWTQLTSAGARLESAPLYIDDTPGLSILDARTRARRLASELKAQGKELGLVILDYLQMMRGANWRAESREREVAEISRMLKNLARDLNVPVLALSQLSRRVEEKGREGRPQLSDLRESGALEQDADVVAFIYRREIYDPTNPEFQRKAEIIIAKQRNGPTDTVLLNFFRESTRFENPAPLSEEAPTAGVSG
ncbi:MAG: replicative DNA helicase [Elusimicrobia bacterium]|nr:replicative DNA helicase [Elusimicrobiota bacterium]